ncbi:uncharacterized protein [Primulina eburnea]|uniref:uncharacterized protein n=1 Tax=Primulina eburnea TaxID=1245227 RepID=UPI003C6C81EC
MGISIAKHRLEILKLATKERKASHLVSRLLTAIKPKTSKFSTNFRSWACRDESPLVIMPSLRYKDAKAEKSKWPVVPNKISKSPLLTANGRWPALLPSSIMEKSLNNALQVIERDGEKLSEDYDDFWSCVVEEIKWDSMFQNLKPT